MLSKIRSFLKKYRYRRMLKTNKSVLDVSPRAILLPSMYLDVRVRSVGTRVHIGEDSMVGCNFVFESGNGDICIGKRTYIGGGTNLISRSSIVIGNDVTIAWGVWIYDHNSHSLDWRERAHDIRRQNEDYRSGRDFIASKDWSTVKTAPIKICDKAWIGFNVIILKGVTIGEGAVVGAGAVVTHDVPPWTIVAGNPAVVKGYIEH